MATPARKIRDDYDPYPHARRDVLGQPLMEDMGEEDLYVLLANLRMSIDERLASMERLNEEMLAMRESVRVSRRA